VDRGKSGCKRAATQQVINHAAFKPKRLGRVGYTENSAKLATALLLCWNIMVRRLILSPTTFGT